MKTHLAIRIFTIQRMKKKGERVRISMKVTSSTMIVLKKKLSNQSCNKIKGKSLQKKTFPIQMKLFRLRKAKVVTTNQTLTIICQKDQLQMDGVLIKTQMNTTLKIGFHFQHSSTIVFFSIKDKVLNGFTDFTSKKKEGCLETIWVWVKRFK